ncbi:2-keto-3-deoxy-L-rhamnonate aldolase-like [Panicum miliaceum]|uniref:2-keto-3-deoxy-L-rhamnonate aldolase-like n=1 Tax=Panicum miliaceum TaxID=4540 RepID=A0A3L6Q312_PANMI|nr:2-keto-3-deoxy-L-rhamnonate aldolase-like [Panicum miliaceum]
MEHSSNGIPEELAFLHALDAARTPAVLRLPEASAVWDKNAFDLGPAGLMLPAVESLTAATEADDTLIICQVETTAIVEVDAIAAVDGVDVVQMDLLDLSASMGYLWDLGRGRCWRH